MDKMTDEQQDDVRTLVKSFRDAALRKIEAAKNCRGGPPKQEVVDAFVKYDTWLKLDDQQRSSKAAERQKAENYTHKADTGHNPFPGCCP
jgi:hypothetical protein